LHHIKPLSQGGEDTQENGITLCPEHHEWVTNGHKFNGYFLSDRKVMLFILGKYLTSKLWRWDAAYEWLKRREK
jgi:hypothetical protein